MDLFDARLFFLLGAIAAAVAYYYQRKVRAIDELPRAIVSVDRISDVRDLLARNRAEGSFAAFHFGSPDRPSPDDTLAAQLSFEVGAVGFDWILLAPRNVEERSRVEQYLQSRGLDLIEKEGNGVRYLRTEQGDVARLCRSLIVELFGVDPSAELEMVYSGFEWRAP